MPSNKFNDLFSSQSREILDLVVQKHGWAGKLLKYKLEESIDTFIREYQKSNVFFNMLMVRVIDCLEDELMIDDTCLIDF